MRYPGAVVRNGDVVAHEYEDGEWRVDAITLSGVNLCALGPDPRCLRASTEVLRLLRRAPGKLAKATRPFLEGGERCERSLVQNIGGHLGVAAIDDDDERGDPGDEPEPPEGEKR